MKSCNEMAESVFTRINEYETAKRRKKKIILSTAVPASFLCAAVIAGIAIHIAGAGGTAAAFKSSPQENSGSAVSSSEVSSDSECKKFAYLDDDMLGVVYINGIEYVQSFADFVIDEAFTADKLIGDARDYDGTYRDSDMTALLYSVKESKNALILKLGNGGTILLERSGELCVNGRDYRFYGYGDGSEKKEKRVGSAKRYIIEVPNRQSSVEPDDEIWTVSGNADELLLIKPNGTQVIYCVGQKIK